MNQEWLEIGKIVAPQGLKGEMRVVSSSDFPERFEEPGERWLKDSQGNPPQKVELVKGRLLPGKKLYVIQLAEVKGRDRAEALRGYKLLIAKSSDSLPVLAEDEYHVGDLVDLEVYNQKTSKVIGIVVDVFTAGNDLLEVQLTQKAAPSSSTRVFIPFVKEIVPIVDLKAGRLEINPPDGLLEINSN